MLVWLSVWSEMQTCIWPSWCLCHSLSLASVKSIFWYRLTRVVLDKGPLYRCVCVCVCLDSHLQFGLQLLCVSVQQGLREMCRWLIRHCCTTLRHGPSLTSTLLLRLHILRKSTFFSTEYLEFYSFFWLNVAKISLVVDVWKMAESCWNVFWCGCRLGPRNRELSRVRLWGVIPLDSIFDFGAKTRRLISDVVKGDETWL